MQTHHPHMQTHHSHLQNTPPACTHSPFPQLTPPRTPTLTSPPNCGSTHAVIQHGQDETQSRQSLSPEVLSPASASAGAAGGVAVQEGASSKSQDIWSQLEQFLQDDGSKSPSAKARSPKPNKSPNPKTSPRSSPQKLGVKAHSSSADVLAGVHNLNQIENFDYTRPVPPPLKLDPRPAATGPSSEGA